MQAQGCRHTGRGTGRGTGCRHKGAGTRVQAHRHGAQACRHRQGHRRAGTRVQAHRHGAQGTGTDTSNSENKG